LGDELRQEEFADAVSDAVGADVDGVFYGEAVAFAGAELGGVTEAYEVAFEFCCEVGQVAVEDGLVAAAHFGFVGWGDFKGSGGGGDELGVDGGDGRDVRGRGEADQASGFGCGGGYAAGSASGAERGWMRSGAG
jgi:hypothetical protein